MKPAPLGSLLYLDPSPVYVDHQACLSPLLRRGQQISLEEDPGLARYRERFFNFYDQRVMDGAWTSAEVGSAAACLTIACPRSSGSARSDLSV